MEIKDYEGNSNALKEKKVKKVVTNPVKTKKKGEFRKLTDAIISEDATNIKSYLLFDVIIPTVKDAIVDSVTEGIQMIFYGERGGKRRSFSSRSSYTSYSRYDKNRESDRSQSRSRGRERDRAVYDYDDIILTDRGEAEDVLDQLREIISMYNTASVADLYDLIGVSADYTANDYGWKDLHNASILRTRQGYLLKLPRAYALDL